MPPRQAFVNYYDTATSTLNGYSFSQVTGCISLREYATEGALQTDGQAALAAAIEDARVSVFSGTTAGATVLLPAGRITIDQVGLPEGVSLRGAGQRATELWQKDGVNHSMIVNAPTISAIGFLHYASVTDMALRKKVGTVDTLGCAIELNCRMGELCHVHRLLITNWPESGIRLNRGGQPVVIRDVHAFGCGAYAIDLRRTAGDVFHMVNLDTISGDNHGKGLIHLGLVGGQGIETFRLANIKAECLVDGTMPCVIDLDGVGARTGIQIDNLGFYDIKVSPAIVRISSGAARMMGGCVRALQHPVLIDDIPAARQVPYDAMRLAWAYDSTIGLL